MAKFSFPEPFVSFGHVVGETKGRFQRKRRALGRRMVWLLKKVSQKYGLKYQFSISQFASFAKNFKGEDDEEFFCTCECFA